MHDRNIWRMPAGGGPAEQLTFDADDEQWQLSELDIPTGIRSVAIAEDLGQLAIADGRGDPERRARRARRG